MKVDFIDLSEQHNPIRKELDRAISEVIDNSAFIKSQVVANFEEEFAKYLNVDYVVSCGNGTDAMEIILKAYDIGSGDEVIVPVMSWISTSEVVATAGAKPIFVDVSPRTFCIDEDKIEAKISSKTKAVIPVHLYGHPAAMKSIIAIAKKHKLKVIEDCAQAHGAEIGGKKIGSFGDAASFSFFPTKNLGAFGDAGAIVSNNTDLKTKVRAIANHGQIERHKHVLHGRNSRMDGLQAAVLGVKLKYLDNWLQKRRELASIYREELQSLGKIVLPTEGKSTSHAYHLYVIKAENREGLKKFLSERGVSSMIHYPKALPFQDCYKAEKYSSKDYPIAAELQEKILSLPFYPGMSKEKALYVCEQIKNFYS